MQAHLPEVEEGCGEPEALEVERAKADGLHEPQHLGNETEDEANEQDNHLVAKLHFHRKDNRLGVGIELGRLWWAPGHHFRIATVLAVPEAGHEQAVKEGAESDDRLDCLASRRAGTTDSETRQPGHDKWEDEDGEDEHKPVADPDQGPLPWKLKAEGTPASTLARLELIQDQHQGQEDPEDPREDGNGDQAGGRGHWTKRSPDERYWLFLPAAPGKEMARAAVGMAEGRGWVRAWTAAVVGAMGAMEKAAVDRAADWAVEVKAASMTTAARAAVGWAGPGLVPMPPQA